ncbi:hypothetical protein GA707_12195 [Nostocoides sp. F2B08]|uniref:hypothetical protein n=1 Tax=Nostocoides sp. F2B08 TaxID=2653936 RepID=UPI001263CC8A|nr:hypothetical protein [Tetrasphaera sp. F2B08]KAB7744198.1 hypothetical protein GA707_12195 [Tetrasphaera sp. F2B08]
MSRIASTRVDALRVAGVEVEWRAVIRHPTLRTVSEPLGEVRLSQIAEVEKAWRTESIRGEPTPSLAPRIAPTPLPPLSGFAEAVGAGVGDHVRHLLFARYWQDNADIGNPDVLRYLLTRPILHGCSTAEVLSESGYAVAIGGGPLTSAAWRLSRHWASAYTALDRPELPVCVEEGRVRSGWAAVRHLGALVTERDARFPRGNPYPLPRLPLPAQRRSIAHSPAIPVWWDA